MIKNKDPRIKFRCHGVAMPGLSHAAIRKVKRDGAKPHIHGNKLWKSSLLLIDYLHKHPPEYTANVLDVGCGWGLSGIWCAKKLGSNVTSVDADADVFPYLQAVAAINGVQTTPQKSLFQQLTTKQLASYDMLIAADICFWDELVDPVFNMINRAIRAGVKHVVIADPERATFLKMAERSMKKHCSELHEWKIHRPVKARGALLVIENA